MQHPWDRTARPYARRHVRDRRHRRLPRAGARRARAHGRGDGATVAPTGRAPGRRRAAASPSAGWRSSTSTSARCSRCTSGRWHLVFNGEIYNYRELRAELEALGHASSPRATPRCCCTRGSSGARAPSTASTAMFAFAIWYDERDRSLTLPPTRSARSPAVLVRDGERLVFASDVQALQEARARLRRPRREALAAFVARGAMPPIDAQLLRAHPPAARRPCAALARGDVSSPPLLGAAAGRRCRTPTRTRSTQLRELLLDSIRLRLRSDVPVGTSLSGGIDSIAIVALSAHLAGDHRRHAFTARFPGFERDEWRYAEAVARARRRRRAPRGRADRAESSPATSTRSSPPRRSRSLSSSIYAQWRGDSRRRARPA